MSSSSTLCTVCKKPPEQDNPFICCVACEARAHLICAGASGSDGTGDGASFMCADCKQKAVGTSTQGKDKDKSRKSSSKGSRKSSGASSAVRESRQALLFGMLQNFFAEEADLRSNASSKSSVQSVASSRRTDPAAHGNRRTGEWVHDQRRVEAPQQAPQQARLAQRRSTAFNVTAARNFEDFAAGINAPPIHRQQIYSHKCPDLPDMTGQVTEWVEFITAYKETTDVFAITDCQNMARIRKAVKFPASEVIKGLTLESSSVLNVLNMLRISFGNPEQILRHLEMEIRRLPRIGERMEGLQNVGLKATQLVSTLRVCDMRDQLNNWSLLSSVRTTLNSILAMRWGDYERQYGSSLTEMTDFLLLQFEYAINAGMEEARIVYETQDTPPQRVLTMEQVSVKCVRCSGTHKLKECQAFKDDSDAAKLQLVQEKKVCYRCLNFCAPRACRQPAKKCPQCQYKHHPLVHGAMLLKYPQSAVVSCVQAPHVGSKFKILPVTIRSNGKEVSTLAFVDDGSNTSIVDTEIASALGMTGPVKSLTIQWTNGQTAIDRESQVVSFVVHSPYGEFTIHGARTFKNTDFPSQGMEKELVERFFPDGNGAAVYHVSTPKVLISIMHAHLTVPSEVRYLDEINLFAVNSKLGWMIYGGGSEAQTYAGSGIRACYNTREVLDNELEEKVRSFFELDSFGVAAAPKVLGKHDARAVKILQDTVKYGDGRYEAGLLWARDVTELPPSYDMCLSRAISLKRKLLKDSVQADNIQKLLADYLEKGYIVRADSTPTSPRHWFLPIFPVHNPQKPDKTRVVWDAAAKVRTGESLNTSLLSGPDLLVPLPDVLMGFREKKIAVAADIGEMFHRVYIRPEDRDCQRFLWIPLDGEEPEEYIMQVCTFGATCSPTTAQYVKNINADKFADLYPEAAEAIKRRFYVDDYLHSFDDVQQASQINAQVYEINMQAGMELKKWRSNYTETIPHVCAPGDESKSFNSDGKVLGLGWNSERDDLRISVDKTLLARHKLGITKREVLRAVMSLFDPLGLLADVVMHAKIILRAIWKTGCGWDERIEEQIVLRWREWCGRVEQLRELHIPRWHGICGSSHLQLHVFVDAGENGFAAAAYFRGQDEGGSIVVSMVMGKCRVAPLRSLSIPRLELMAAVLGVRLAHTICQGSSVKIHDRVFWTDSNDLRYWLASEHRRYRQFIALRINEILDKSKEIEWRYVPTADNVADDATKIKTSEPGVNGLSRWLSGPKFLYENDEMWPANHELAAKPEDSEELAQLFTVKQVDLGAIPDVNRFSTWRRLRIATAYVLRIVLPGSHEEKSLGPNEVWRAEEELYRAAQLADYGEVVVQLRRDNNSSLSKTHPLYQLSPQLDEKQLMRVSGRLNDDFPETLRSPIILHRRNRITMLLIHHYHVKFNHGNAETVVNELRQQFHVAKLRAAVRSVIHQCMFCRKWNAKPSIPRMGPLPSARTLIGSMVFAHTGMDYFGPFDVSVGRRVEKRWVCLFTCMAIRAVHTEIVPSLDMHSCMMALRMFTRRRGTPIEIWSDNATCFKATAKEWMLMQGTFPKVKFNFIPPAAPHFGGTWERMGRTIKSNAYKMLKNRRLTDELLRCSMVEAEWIVNCHPLTYIPVLADNPEALTPNHFLLGSSYAEKYQGPAPPPELLGDFLRKSYRAAIQMRDHFCRRFQREVIPILNIRPKKWQEMCEPLKVGDVVQVADDQRRGLWKMGRVVEAVPGSDGQVRQVKIKTATGLMHRPVSKVAKVDVL